MTRQPLPHVDPDTLLAARRDDLMVLNRKTVVRWHALLGERAACSVRTHDNPARLNLASATLAREIPAADRCRRSACHRYFQAIDEAVTKDREAQQE